MRWRIEIRGYSGNPFKIAGDRPSRTGRFAELQSGREGTCAPKPIWTPQSTRAGRPHRRDIGYALTRQGYTLTVPAAERPHARQHSPDVLLPPTANLKPAGGSGRTARPRPLVAHAWPSTAPAHPPHPPCPVRRALAHPRRPPCTATRTRRCSPAWWPSFPRSSATRFCRCW